METTEAPASVDEKKKRSEPSPLEVFVEQLIICFGLYVSSIGPMYWVWFDAKYVTGPWIIAAFYEPLWRLAAIPWIGNAINWYVSWWI